MAKDLFPSDVGHDVGPESLVVLKDGATIHSMNEVKV